MTTFLAIFSQNSHLNNAAPRSKSLKHVTIFLVYSFLVIEMCRKHVAQAESQAFCAILCLPLNMCYITEYSSTLSM